MYAVVSTGGKQYRVQKGETLRVEKIPGEVGSKVILDKVLMVADGENIRVGQPLIEKAAVQASIVEQDRAKKILVFKYKRRKRYRRKAGHRQPYTAIRNQEHLVEGHLATDFARDFLNPQGFALLNLVLFSACADDRVHRVPPEK